MALIQKLIFSALILAGLGSGLLASDSIAGDFGMIGTAPGDTGITDEALLHPNVLKVNLAAAYFKKLTLVYERDFNERWSGVLAAGYKFQGKLPKWASLGEFIATSSTGGIQGFSIAPEVRYKLLDQGCEKPAGLYLGLYGALTRLYGDLRFKYWNGDAYVDLGGAGDMWEFGAGLQLGYQFTLGGRWVFDLMFMGPRMSRQRLHLRFDSEFVQDYIPLIEEEINKRLEYFGHDPISLPQQADVDFKLKISNFRYAIGVGYRF